IELAVSNRQRGAARRTVKELGPRQLLVSGGRRLEKDQSAGFGQCVAALFSPDDGGTTKAFLGPLHFAGLQFDATQIRSRLLAAVATVEEAVGVHARAIVV